MRIADFLRFDHSAPVCGSCAHWVASRIHDNGRFYCPPDAEGVCGQQAHAEERPLLSAESTCLCWQRWSRGGASAA